jgi:hypothetical protein
MSVGSPIPERRERAERRVLSWKTMFYGYTRSRRVTVRRDGEQGSVYSDWYHPWLFLLATGIMLLSCLDAFLTLQLMELGMIEANPLMAAAMRYGTSPFVIIKVTVTGLAILTLVFFARVQFFNIFRTGLLLTLAFCLYCCLICYEFVSLMTMLSAV